MLSNDLDECVAIIGRTIKNLLATADPTIPAFDLRLACGDILANAGDYIVEGTIGTSLGNCFNLARQAGATYQKMDNVRLAAQSETPQSVPAVIIAGTAIRFALIQQSYILAATTFVSADDATAMLVAVQQAFAPSEDFAANTHDTADYLALIALRAATTNDLATRARPLPRYVAYTLTQRMPALWIANRLYGDAERTEEIIAENKPVHPAFMPQSGRVLSA
jgi:prophage DNA circulation protein